MPKKNGGWFSTERIAFVALLTAMQIVLGNVTQIPLVGKQFTFGFLPTAAAGALMGPLAAAIVGGLGDFFGAHLFPQGAYFAGFTLTSALVGAAYGLLLHRCKLRWWRVVLATALAAVINLFLNSYWLSLLYASRAYLGWVGVRAATYLAEAPVQVALTYFTLRGLAKLPLPPEMRPERDAQERKEKA